jgi:hypothetical protein
MLTTESTDLWKDMVSKKERERLAAAKYALCHRFESPDHLGKPEADSELLLRRVFLCLRLVQPIAEPFRFVQLVDNETGREVVRFSEPEGELSPLDGDVFREIAPAQIRQLRSVLPSFMKLAAAQPSPTMRAINLFHEGYFRTYQPAVQVVVWCMGIDACL